MVGTGAYPLNVRRQAALAKAKAVALTEADAKTTTAAEWVHGEASATGEEAVAQQRQFVDELEAKHSRAFQASKQTANARWRDLCDACAAGTGAQNFLLLALQSYVGWREIGGGLTREVVAKPTRERHGDSEERVRTRHGDEGHAVWLIEINPLLRALLPCVCAARASNDATLVDMLGEARHVNLAWAELSDALALAAQQCELDNVVVRWAIKKKAPGHPAVWCLLITKANALTDRLARLFSYVKAVEQHAHDRTFARPPEWPKWPKDTSGASGCVVPTARASARAPVVLHRAPLEPSGRRRESTSDINCSTSSSATPTPSS